MTGEVRARSPEDQLHEEDRSVPVEAPATPEEWDALARDWESLHQGYYLGSGRHAVLECARHLEASAAQGGTQTALWTLGLYYVGGYVIHARPHAESERRVRDVMGVLCAPRDASCEHPAHPCDDVPEDGELENFPLVLEMLAHPERDADHEAVLAEELADEAGYVDEEWRESWYGGRLTREIWACPQNLAGFARAFLG
ncbi:hypothetical protein ACIRPT_17860 [Streptomyces sp. NPDC101227]|uniref:hypothetical protein n=1 Tax=Streptomyces sp. NPDC101227 TaxID=3366136 RepID=UPI0037FBFAEF